MRAVAVLVVLILAPLVPASADDPPLQTLPLGVEDCLGLIAFVKVRAADLQPYVPPGFRLRGQGTDQAVNLAIEADRCARMTTLEGTVEGGVYGSIWVRADPPSELRLPEPGGYYLGWDSLVPDAARRDILTAAGVPARGGSVDPVAADVYAHAFRMTMDGLGAFDLSAAGADLPLPSAGRAIQYNPSDDGTLSRWKFRWTNDAFGQSFAGAVTVPADSWVADIIGAPVAPAVFFVGLHMTYDQGSIEFPIQNPAA